MVQVREHGPARREGQRQLHGEGSPFHVAKACRTHREKGHLSGGHHPPPGEVLPGHSQALCHDAPTMWGLGPGLDGSQEPFWKPPPGQSCPVWEHSDGRGAAALTQIFYVVLN